jgi:tetratricopeptide (TPR) repeat protein
VHLHKNVYVNPSDPQYYEKMLRYANSTSPEVHYRLGQKYEREGNRAKAAEHYRQCLRQRSSDFSVLAARALRRLETVQTEAADGQVQPLRGGSSRFPVRTVAVLLSLLFMLSILLLVFTLRLDTVSATLSKLKPWGVGKSVTHETVELPYILYFPYAATEKDIEDTLYKEALAVGRSNPNRTVLVYGVAGENVPQDRHAVPLTNPNAATDAFAVAQYQADQDSTVRIRFLNKEFQGASRLTQFGTNLVRTALQAYIEDHGEAPADVRALASNYPDNYLSFIPVEPESGSDRIVSVYDGSGGWVYRPSAGEPGTMFLPNVPGLFSLQEEQQFQPVHLLVDKRSHTLQLLMGEKSYLQTPVGLGAGGATPEGSFRVADRVLDPAGSKPGVYGTAALGLGDIAVHGTQDETSIGKDASLGCVRVANAVMSTLFPLVPRGAEVKVTDQASGAPAVTASADSADSTDNWALLVPPNRSGQEERVPGKRFTWLG